MASTESGLFSFLDPLTIYMSILYHNFVFLPVLQFGENRR